MTGEAVSSGFAELERQQLPLASCTRLYQQLSDHFVTLERGLASCSDGIRHKRRAVEARSGRALDSLRRRELSIDGFVSRALEQLDSLATAGSGEGSTASEDAAGLAESLRALCAKMDSAAFFGFVAARHKETDALRAGMPPALRCCVDPAKFIMDAVADVFPVDWREMKNPADLSWACVLILEAAVPALADPDPEIGATRPLVPRAARDRARGMAREWKEAVELKGGVEAAKLPDAHAFL